MCFAQLDFLPNSRSQFISETAMLSITIQRRCLLDNRARLMEAAQHKKKDYSIKTAERRKKNNINGSINCDCAKCNNTYYAMESSTEKAGLFKISFVILQQSGVFNSQAWIYCCEWRRSRDSNNVVLAVRKCNWIKPAQNCTLALIDNRSESHT